MADTQSPMPLFCWHELMTRDPATAQRFYCELLGWGTLEANMGGTTYTMFTAPTAPQGAAGMLAMTGPQFEGVPANWLAYIAVEDLDATVARVTKLGGQVRVPITPIPNMGRFAVIADPTGAVVALYQQ
ncbi:MAG: VOC family protein [Phycisphaerales bacterium]|nr:VOC family protein [Phycisphaerales bacterium]